MITLLHHLVHHNPSCRGDDEAIRFRDRALTYRQLADETRRFGAGLLEAGLEKQERVAIYLPKRLETVVAFFGTSWAGGVFVPVNPLLKPEQVAHVLRDCNARFLVTSGDRLAQLEPALEHCHDLHTVVLTDSGDGDETDLPRRRVEWDAFLAGGAEETPPPLIDGDMAAILYTSGSTGRPKGVVLSHRNMVAGAQSVAQYLENRREDRLLAVLPFSFDYGFSQLTTAFTVGASVVLMDYLLPRDVIRAVERHQITGLAAVPPLWVQLARLPWPEGAVTSLRYITNSGGAMPGEVLKALRQALPSTRVYLMYGLTEAFRSTYLPPEELDRRPDSMGRAIPNAEIMVVREDGSPCAPGEPGELVHRGALVALGYWNDPERTRERFRPAPGRPGGIPLQETAVWSGDTVRMDEEGFLYFIGRKDDMIKTSGYRVSPTEVEEVCYASGLVGEAAAIGLPHSQLGQAIVVVATPAEGAERVDEEALQNHCRERLPAFMVPLRVITEPTLPRNPNGKIDRKQLALRYQDLFSEESSP
ncbi:MAG TPA: acyl-CoA ligase (AMP-forming), exosortase A system-associated [Thiotrichales bacterium]|nr:acyl-CoA ligase (AMP-forming), exosortase A system-associated [Thiotrichales bacterium]